MVMGQVIPTLAFLAAVVLVMWRPKGLNEAVPALGGAALVVAAGAVTGEDIRSVWNTIGGSAMTIAATIVIAITLESAGVFEWAAEGIANKSRGSGLRLFLYVNALCFLLTLVFNNDGSILISTPIIIRLLNRYGLSPGQQIPFLISGAFMATASSVIIGVSNVVNLISLRLIELPLLDAAVMTVVPALFGLACMLILLLVRYRNKLPLQLPAYGAPIASSRNDGTRTRRMMLGILVFVLLLRLALFAASGAGIPIEYVPMAGSLVLLLWRWAYLGLPPADILRRTPWHVFGFAFGMYVLVKGLQQAGLTGRLAALAAPLADTDPLTGSLGMGALLTLLSNMFNNHPALMIGTLTLTGMELPAGTLRLYYLACLVGSDIGALLLPVGTLASLIWLHILRRHGIGIDWAHYVKTTALVIPPTVLVTTAAIYFWSVWVL